MKIIDNAKDWFIVKSGKYDTVKRYRKGKITLEQALDEIALLFVGGAYSYFDHTYNIENHISSHNLDILELKKELEVVNNPDGYHESVVNINRKGLMLDEYVHEQVMDKSHMRNMVCFECAGYPWWLGIKKLEEIKGSPIDLDACIDRYCAEEVRDKIDIPGKLTEGYDYPTKSQMQKFLEYLKNYVYLQEKGLPYENENGVLIDENGNMIEEDIMKKWIPVDCSEDDRMFKMVKSYLAHKQEAEN
jgi:hypothetical protein